MKICPVVEFRLGRRSVFIISRSETGCSIKLESFTADKRKAVEISLPGMKIEKTILEGVVIIEPDVFTDERGFFVETFQEKRYQELLERDVHFIQDNFSSSKKGVLRGMHYQAPPFGQAKLVQVLKGRAFDVAIDIRFGSPTFGKYTMVELSGTNHRQFFIPEGFAHGFLALEDNTLFQYKCTNVYSKEHERGILWNDSVLGIDWGMEDPIISDKDGQHMLLKDIPEEFVYKN